MTKKWISSESTDVSTIREKQLSKVNLRFFIILKKTDKGFIEKGYSSCKGTL
jgi:hypothetical protein